jgi:small subunit ribosomal protein S1
MGLLHASDISWKKTTRFSKMFAPDTEIDIKILEIDKDNNKLSLGLKQLSEDPWITAERELKTEEVVKGIIRSITKFGAFLELEKYEGVEGLIHRSELSWTKKQISPKDVLKVGQEVEAQILNLEFEKKRISLGLKQVLPNPWDSIHEKIKVGDIQEGKITNITKFGIFISVTDEIDGLIHTQDVTWDDNVKGALKSFKKGKKIEYKILEINSRERRISCGLKQLTENPYNILRKKYHKGTALEGTITKIINTGIFVKIEEKFEGFVHISNISRRKIESMDEAKEKYKKGDKIGVVVLKIIPEQKRISLSIKDFDWVQEKKVMEPYLTDDKPGSYNPFANLLKKKDDVVSSEKPERETVVPEEPKSEKKTESDDKADSVETKPEPESEEKSESDDNADSVETKPESKDEPDDKSSTESK